VVEGDYQHEPLQSGYIGDGGCCSILVVAERVVVAQQQFQQSEVLREEMFLEVAGAICLLPQLREIVAAPM